MPEKISAHSIRRFTLRFAELTMHKRLKEAMAHLDYTEMTEVQAQTIPYALIGRDLAVASKTGSGKTLAYLIPLMHRLLTSRALSTRPTGTDSGHRRELAKQVYAQLRFLWLETQVHCSLVLGGENFNEQIKSLRAKRRKFWCATPGRLLNHLKRAVSCLMAGNSGARRSRSHVRSGFC